MDDSGEADDDDDEDADAAGDDAAADDAAADDAAADVSDELTTAATFLAHADIMLSQNSWMPMSLFAKVSWKISMLSRLLSGKEARPEGEGDVGLEDV